MMFDVIALGEPMIEFNQSTPEVPVYLQGFGGDTANAVIAAARQGARTAYLTRVGDDDLGNMLFDLWRKEGVDSTCVVRDQQAHTGAYFVTHGLQGHRFSYLRAGSAASRMTPENLSLEVIKQSHWLHVSGISQAISPSACTTVEAAISLARASGVRVSYDPNLRLQLWSLEQARRTVLATLPDTDLFLPGLEEARALSGLDDIASIFDWCFSNGAALVVLKCGAEGVWWAESGTAPRHQPPLQVTPVDATGAGDCFDGSLLARLTAGDDFGKAIHYASVAAGLSTRDYGAINAIPVAEEVLAASTR